jgi:hypothetical protein
MLQMLGCMTAGAIPRLKTLAEHPRGLNPGSDGAKLVKATLAALALALVLLGCADLTPPEERSFANPCPAGKTYMRAFNSCWPLRAQPAR